MCEFALKKIILNSTEGPNIFNNYKDLCMGGGFTRKLKNEYTSCLNELYRDPNI